MSKLHGWYKQNKVPRSQVLIHISLCKVTIENNFENLCGGGGSIAVFVSLQCFFSIYRLLRICSSFACDRPWTFCVLRIFFKKEIQKKSLPHSPATGPACAPCALRRRCATSSDPKQRSPRPGCSAQFAAGHTWTPQPPV